MTAAQLRAKVEARYSEKRLTELTRPEQAGFSTPDTTFLEAACTDVIGILDGQGIATYDNTDAAIVAESVDAVIALLQWRNMASDANETRWDRVRKRLEGLRKTRRGNRISPSTSSDRDQLISPEIWDDGLPGKPGISDDTD